MLIYMFRMSIATPKLFYSCSKCGAKINMTLFSEITSCRKPITDLKKNPCLLNKNPCVLNK